MNESGSALQGRGQANLEDDGRHFQIAFTPTRHGLANLEFDIPGFLGTQVQSFEIQQATVLESNNSGAVRNTGEIDQTDDDQSMEREDTQPVQPPQSGTGRIAMVILAVIVTGLLLISLIGWLLY
ncbi:MAG: hypothetical protein WC702_01845 [Patescibacteria group bacterium]|jgi:hypothetical protein